MRTSVKIVPPEQVRVDLLVIASGQLHDKVPDSLLGLDEAAGGALNRVVTSGDFTGDRDQATILYPTRGPRRVLLLGLGNHAHITRAAIRSAAAVGTRRAAAMGARAVAFYITQETHSGVSAEALGQVATEGALQGAWRFVELKAVRDGKAPVESFDLIVAREHRPDVERGRVRGHAIGIGQRLARNLQMLPGNVCTPEYLATIARDLARAYRFKVTVLNRAQMEKEGMGALLSVAQGSTAEPRFLALEYKGAGRAAPVCLVGKGVTFDSGGISLKPADKMEEMKYDMSGAAAVLGTFEVLGQLKPAVNVVGLIPTTENLPSGSATRPGDVVRSHFGKTIEIVNTDAEGRLILADALSYARRYQPSCVLDAATLTGAVVIGLGHHAVGLMGNDDRLLDEVRHAGDRAGERCWPLPLWDEYREQIRSDVADVKNSGGRPAGSITAGWFLREFVDGYPWAHLDIAGTAYIDAERPGLAKGPTGLGVRLFSEFVFGRARGVIPGRATHALAAAVALTVVAAPAPGQAARPDSAPPAPPPAFLPVPPIETPAGPLSPGSRIVFTRDSLLWSSGYTLADLLLEVPGTYAARTGFVGQPTTVHYGGRGDAGIEILYDGQPIVPLGADSLAVDPGRISLIGLRRVEVERHPAYLRVHLVSERHELPGARTLLRIVSGDFKAAGYAGQFQYRWTGGIGIDLSADYINAKGGQGTTRDATWFDLRATADWTPSPLVSAAFQLRSLTLDREATSGPDESGVPRRDAARRESQFRIVASTRPHRQGLSVEAGLQSARWRADSATADTVLGERTMHVGFLGVRLAGPRASADLSTRLADYHTPVETRLRAGWMPLGWMTLSGGARVASHRDDRTSQSADASLALHAGAWSLVGDVRWAEEVVRPVLAGDTAQTTLDLGARAGFAARRLTFHAGVERRDAFQAPGLSPVETWPAFPPTGEATFLVSDLTLTLGALTLAGWYADPLSGNAPALEPPSHSRATLTFRSKFLRTFRSGAFDLKVQIALEAWGEGTAGLDADAAPVVLPGASVAEAFLQFELASFHAFYSLKNALRSREGYVPGFEYPRNLQTFGVKWLFRE